MQRSTQSGLDQAHLLVASSEAPSGPDCVDNSLGRREGFSVDEKPFFKVWAAKALLSDDLASLTDHQRSTWLYLLCIASLKHPRWRVRVSPLLAEKCRTTPAKLNLTLGTLAQLGMCVVESGEVYFPTAEALNEDTYGRAPSAAPERVRERVKRHRETRRNEVGNALRNDPVTAKCNDHKEKEQEEEQEKEEDQDRVVTLPAAAAALPIREACDLWLSATGTTVTAMTGDQIQGALDRLPADWVLDAIRETGLAGAKSWRYTLAILTRWEHDGREKQAAPHELTPAEQLEEDKARRFGGFEHVVKFK